MYEINPPQVRESLRKRIVQSRYLRFSNEYVANFEKNLINLINDFESKYKNNIMYSQGFKNKFLEEIEDQKKIYKFISDRVKQLPYHPIQLKTDISLTPEEEIEISKYFIWD